jgi:aminopeptidase
MFSDKTLEAYADLTVRIGLNLREGQRLLIVGPLANGGVSLQAAPLVRAVAKRAYRAGAELVEAVWGDEDLQLVRFANARKDTFDRCSAWLPQALLEHANAGHATLSIYANDPDHLNGQPVEQIGALQLATAKCMRPFRELVSKNRINWCVVGAPDARWAAKVFPGLEPAAQLTSLAEAISRLCRLDRPDPVAAWREHLAALAQRRDFLNARHYDALRYRAPGTALTVGLPRGHLWVSGQSESQQGIRHTPNLPTEEVFSIVHKDRVDGTVRGTRPLIHGGTVIENFSLTFERGRVTGFTAATGEAMLRQLIETDPGASRLGEVALVPASSPISQAGRLFYNTLYDENAASHLALGSAYRFNLDGGEQMSDEDFERAGGNRSGAHADFMIGSADMDIDGVDANGRVEPLMRNGEWATKL